MGMERGVCWEGGRGKLGGKETRVTEEVCWEGGRGRLGGKEARVREEGGERVAWHGRKG